MEPISAEMEAQCSLPFVLGGMGLRSALRTSTAAFWGSLADALPDLKLHSPALADWILQVLQQADVGPGSLAQALSEKSSGRRAMQSVPRGSRCSMAYVRSRYMKQSPGNGVTDGSIMHPPNLKVTTGRAQCFQPWRHHLRQCYDRSQDVAQLLT